MTLPPHSLPTGGRRHFPLNRLLPVRADTPVRLTAGFQQLRHELDTLEAGSAGQASLPPDQLERLLDLRLLEDAILASNDRSTLTNNSSHNLGVFTRYKKLPDNQPASFSVLAPGHSTDDDHAVVALYLPAGQAVVWQGKRSDSPAPSVPQALTVLPGEQLEVADHSGEEAEGYLLSLPVFTISSSGVDGVDLPSLTQAELDAEPETAPLD